MECEWGRGGGRGGGSGGGITLGDCGLESSDEEEGAAGGRAPSVSVQVVTMSSSSAGTPGPGREARTPGPSHPGTPRTPAAAPPVCLVCLSPLSAGWDRAATTPTPPASRTPPPPPRQPAATAGAAADRRSPKARRGLRLGCGHHLHVACLAGCREHGLAGCPSCRAGLPPGYTPEGARLRERGRRDLEAQAEARRLQGLQGGYSSSHIVRRTARARAAVAQQQLRSRAWTQAWGPRVGGVVRV